jgi:hypothetical protein
MGHFFKAIILSVSGILKWRCSQGTQRHGKIIGYTINLTGQ